RPSPLGGRPPSFVEPTSARLHPPPCRRCLVHGIPAQPSTQTDHGHAKNKVQPVVSGVERNKVGARFLVDDQAVDPKNEIYGAATNEEEASHTCCPGHGQTGHAKQQMDDVVENGYLEYSKQHGAGFMSREGHGAVIGGDTREKAQYTHQQKNNANAHGGVVKRQPHRMMVFGGVRSGGHEVLPFTLLNGSSHGEPSRGKGVGKPCRRRNNTPEMPPNAGEWPLR